VSDPALAAETLDSPFVSYMDPAVGQSPARTRRPEPVRRRGEPFFDQLVASTYSPQLVRRTLLLMIQEQYTEAARIHRLRGWGGAQTSGNDRYQYSLEQDRRLAAVLPGAQLLRPSQSLMYGIAGALVYPMRYGDTADECPTSAQINDVSQIQRMLADGHFYETPSLFDPDPATDRKVVWLLFTGNFLEGGPLAAYLALPGGMLPERRVDWPHIEPLLSDSDADGHDDPDSGGDTPKTPVQPLPLPEPTLNLQLRR
jgi:hypothetical protein